MGVRVEVLRVFVDEEGEFGNELGVVDSTPATAGREQEIAAELGFSETVFIDRIDGGVAELRIFTPTTEFPFAGHPTVGTAWHLIDLGHPITALDVPAGRVAVTREDDLVFVAARPEWAPVLGYHQLGSPREIDELDPDEVPGDFEFYWAWQDEAAGRVRARMFGRGVGIREDQATGGAAVALTGALRRGLDIEQGLGSRIVTRWDAPLAAVGGRTVRDRVIELG